MAAAKGNAHAPGGSTLDRLPPIAKAGVGFLFVVLIGLLYFVVFYSDVDNDLTQAQQQESRLKGQLAEADERALILEARDALTATSGRAPAGWLGPWISQSAVTPDLLAEAGFRYCLDWCHDDQPTWMKTRSGRILSVPYPQELNDIPQIVGRRREGDEFADMIVDTYDVMIRECLDRPLVMGIALHAYLVGQPHRFKHLARALRHIAGSGADLLWLTTAGAIADHAIGLAPGVVPE